MTSPSYPTDKAQYRPQAAQSPWASEQVYDSPSGPPPSYDAPPSRFYERRESEERKEDVEFTPRNRHSWNAPYEQGYANEPTYLGVQGNSGRYLSPPSHPSCSRSAPSSPAPYMSYPQGYDPNRAPQGYSPNGAPPQDYSYNRAGSSSPSGRPSGLLGGLKSFAPGASPSQLLNPPPPPFNRPPPATLPNNPFPSSVLFAMEDLPPEVIHEISGYVPEKDLPAFAKTCHLFYLVAIPRLYRHVIFTYDILRPLPLNNE